MFQPISQSTSSAGSPWTVADRAIAAAFALALVIAPPAHGQAPPPTPAPRFADSVEVRVANLEVHVTDRHGRPVTGLRREDFTVLEDGEVREIVNFLAVAGAQPAAAEPGDAAAATLPGASDAETTVRLAIFVDSFNLHIFNRKGVLKELVRFVRERPAVISEISVVSFDGAFHVVQPFTADLGRIEVALAGMEEETGGGVQKVVARKLAEETVSGAHSEAAALAAARAYAAEVRDGSRRTLLCLRELVATLAGARGRSVLLVVSDGFQLRAAEDVFERVAATYRSAAAATEALSFDVSDRFDELTSYANASGVTFYTIGATGVQPPDYVSAEHGSPFSGFGRSRGGSSGRSITESMLEMMRNAAMREPLEGLASETGGKALINRASLLGDLEEMAEGLSSYYSLGFEPAPPFDGRERRLEVRVARNGVRVSHRNSVRLKSQEEEAVDAVLAAVHGVSADNRLGFKVAVAPPPYRRSDSAVLLPVAFLVPCRAVALMPSGDQLEGSVELVAVARDPSGRLSSPVSVVREIRVAPSEADELCVVGATLEVRPGHNTLGLGVRDLAGGATSTVAVDVEATIESSESRLGRGPKAAPVGAVDVGPKARVAASSPSSI